MARLKVGPNTPVALAEWEAGGQLLWLPPVATALLTSASTNCSSPTSSSARATTATRDGTPTSETDNIRLALRPLFMRCTATPLLLIPEQPGVGGGSAKKMIREGHCRNRVNKDISRVRRLFRWAASKRLVPATPFLCHLRPSKG